METKLPLRFCYIFVTCRLGFLEFCKNIIIVKSLPYKIVINFFFLKSIAGFFLYLVIDSNCIELFWKPLINNCIICMIWCGLTFCNYAWHVLVSYLFSTNLWYSATCTNTCIMYVQYIILISWSFPIPEKLKCLCAH